MSAALIATVLLLSQGSTEFAAVLSWSQSVRSFEGVYTLKQESDDAILNWEYRIAYKFDSAGKFISIDGLNPGTHGGMTRETHSLYRGVLTSRIDRESGSPTGDVLGQDEQLPIPPGAFLTPEEIFGAYDGITPLEEIFAPEHASVHFVNGEKYLSLQKFQGSRFLDIALNSDNTPARLEWVVRDNRPIEALREVCNCDPFEVRAVMVSIVLEEMTEIDGVLFPLKVTRTMYAYDKAEGDRIAKEHSEGRLSAAEYTVIRLARKGKPSVVQTMMLETVRLNQPLAASDFTISFPKGSAVVDKRSNSVVTLTDEVVDLGLFPKIIETLTGSSGTQPKPLVADETTSGVAVEAPVDSSPPVPDPPWYTHPAYPYMIGLCLGSGVLIVAILISQRRR